MKISAPAEGLVLYLRSTQLLKSGGTIGFVVFGAALVGVQIMVFFGSPPASPTAAALTALIGYAVFAAIAGWLETRRGARRELTS